MKPAEVRKMTDEELASEVQSLRKKIYDLRCQVATDKIEDPSQFKKTRRDIARMLTETTARRKVKA
ncbi:MAG: 50S ribosomal protein L29 [Planctomycetes bacterium]|nr:50S ribosomal protein L29 [Planctomycetota bacterium]